MYSQQQLKRMTKQQIADIATRKATNDDIARTDVIMRVADQTEIFDACDWPSSSMSDSTTKITLIQDDTVSAIEKLSDKGHVAALNFASYKNPGGQFLCGSMAQEECLCHYSFLYSVLRCMTDYYEYNKKHLNRALYTDRALYSPGVVFTPRDNVSCTCDIITCAATNYRAASKYQNVSPAENTLVMQRRVEFLLGIAQVKNVDTLILGAWGCGIFGNSPRDIAKIFYDAILKNPCIPEIVFAIPKDATGTYDKFAEVMQ